MELGIVQNIRINNEWQDLETIWFAQGSGPIRNVLYKPLRDRDFKISDVLIKAGFKIPDPEKFDADLKNLFVNEVRKLLH